ncbi:MAG: hypothetical protein WCT46_02560 [Candidatus Gracilibacteria bacterium]
MVNSERMERVRDETSRMTGTERIMNPLRLPGNRRVGPTRREVRMRMGEVLKTLNADESPCC